MVSEKVAKLQARLNESRAFLDSILDQVGDRWDVQIYSDGAGWTTRQLLIHLMISDKGQTATVQQIAAGGDPLPADFDLERFNRRSVEKGAATTPDEARAVMRESRGALLAWTETVTDEALEHTGRHASGNIFSATQYLKIMAIHERDHARDMAKALDITPVNQV
ncbi:MAG: DinB family protein [Chloroflexota bacterium]|nr:DinB family protein [Chloroflexota bacterium]